MTTPDTIHDAELRLQTILKAVVVGAKVQDPASRRSAMPDIRRSAMPDIVGEVRRT